MNHTFKLYIPVFDNDGNRVPEAFKLVDRSTVDRFGGNTCYQARGSYRMEDGTIAHDEIIVCEVLTSDEGAEYFMKCLAEGVCQYANQESVLLSVDGVPQFIVTP